MQETQVPNSHTDLSDRPEDESGGGVSDKAVADLSNTDQQIKADNQPDRTVAEHQPITTAADAHECASSQQSVATLEAYERASSQQSVAAPAVYDHASRQQSITAPDAYERASSQQSVTASDVYERAYRQRSVTAPDAYERTSSQHIVAPPPPDPYERAVAPLDGHERVHYSYSSAIGGYNIPITTQPLPGLHPRSAGASGPSGYADNAGYIIPAEAQGHNIYLNHHAFGDHAPNYRPMTAYQQLYDGNPHGYRVVGTRREVLPPPGFRDGYDYSGYHDRTHHTMRGHQDPQAHPPGYYSTGNAAVHNLPTRSSRSPNTVIHDLPARSSRSPNMVVPARSPMQRTLPMHSPFGSTDEPLPQSPY
jgi:hypothetical protein